MDPLIKTLLDEHITGGQARVQTQEQGGDVWRQENRNNNSSRETYKIII